MAPATYKWYDITPIDTNLSQDTDIKTYMLVVRGLDMPFNGSVQIPMNFVNTTFKQLAWHWTSMTGLNSTYTISGVNWSSSPPTVTITNTSAALGSSFFFKVTFV
jgi:hypothetical protein